MIPLLLALWLAPTALAQDAPAGPAAAAPAGSAATLDDAYQKEFAYLLAEREALRARKAEEEARGAATMRDARAELDRLQARLVSLQATAEAAEASLTDAERASSTAADGRDMVDNALFQARERLDSATFTVPDTTDADLAAAASALGAALAEGRRRLAEGASVRREEGTYFLKDGTQVRGPVLRIGEVASFGLSPAGMGPLKPVGPGQLGIYRDDPATSAALAEGRIPSTVPVFLYESTDKPIDERAPRTWMAYLISGGVAGAVIVALGVAALALALLRALGLVIVGRGGAKFTDEVVSALREGGLQAARRRAAAGGGALARVVQAVLGGFERPRGELEDVAQEAILAEQPAIDRFGTAILVIAAVAPLLGLLGTVTGMIATFDILTEFGTGDPRRLSGGISEALVTTQLGLMVAIPALLIGNLLNAWAARVAGRLDAAALRLLNASGEPARPPRAVPAPSTAAPRAAPAEVVGA
jgi:biopolymer transport protein ExbB